MPEFTKRFDREMILARLAHGPRYFTATTDEGASLIDAMIADGTVTELNPADKFKRLLKLELAQ